MNVPVSSASHEAVILGSRFLTELFPIHDQAEVREKIKQQKQKYADATHVVHAFICGANGEVMGMSDDGEPGGTAGRPMLDVLKGSGVTNTLVTVTRWFGGTLLGTGGLVRAYGGAAKEVIAAAHFEQLVEKKIFSFTADYSTYQTIKRLLEKYPVSDAKETFGTGVTVTGKIPASQSDEMSARIFDISSGRVSVEITNVW